MVLFMLDCAGEEMERGAQCFFGVSKSAVSGLVPDLKETLADWQVFQIARTTGTCTLTSKFSLPKHKHSGTWAHVHTHSESIRQRLTHTHTQTEGVQRKVRD